MQQGVLLINLGSPDSTDVKDVRNYLRQFLMDKNVIDYPYIFRSLLVKGIILNTRPPKSAAAYAKIWTDDGSPLVVYTRQLMEHIRFRQNITVDFAMRYGNPSIPSTIRKMYENGVRDLYVIPMYPQYAMSTTETVLQEVEKAVKQLQGLEYEWHRPFYNDTDYLDSLAAHTKEQLEGLEYDRLLFSFHGLPERHIYKTDRTNTCRIDNTCCFEDGLPSHDKCYRHQCYYVAHRLAERLHIDKNKIDVAFQSRLGRDKWLDPSTVNKVAQLAGDGITRLAVVSPAFVADCLETLEELNMELRKNYMENGGMDFHYISCLNNDERWTAVVNGWIENWKKHTT